VRRHATPLTRRAAHGAAGDSCIAGQQSGRRTGPMGPRPRSRADDRWAGVVWPGHKESWRHASTNPRSHATHDRVSGAAHGGAAHLPEHVRGARRRMGAWAQWSPDVPVFGCAAYDGRRALGLRLALGAYYTITGPSLGCRHAGGRARGARGASPAYTVTAHRTRDVLHMPSRNGIRHTGPSGPRSEPPMRSPFRPSCTSPCPRWRRDVGQLVGRGTSRRSTCTGGWGDTR